MPKRVSLPSMLPPACCTADRSTAPLWASWGAVSYTHLDVYKRQEQVGPHLAGAALAHPLGPVVPGAVVGDDVDVQVDVYKRQLWRVRAPT